ncbi:MAG: hypothetical protein KDA37_03565 [Planctomycetales bacterium]|nr:hypothetical protein [Planctomycetales bacterium]
MTLPDPHTKKDPREASTQRASRNFSIALLYVLAFLSGVSQTFGLTSSLAELVSSVLFVSAVTSAAVADSRVRRFAFLRVLQELFFFTWPIASLIYLVRTRGWRGLGWWCLHAIGLFLAMCFSFLAAFVALY